MSKDINEAKFHGFALGIEVAKYLSDHGRTVDLKGALEIVQELVEGDLTLTDPENSGQGMDRDTAAVVRGISISSVSSERQHAIGVQEGLSAIIDSALED